MKKLLTIILLSVQTASFAEVKKCSAITQAKTQCTRSASVDGFCKQHNPKGLKCGASTKAGGVCKNGVKVAGLHCKTHAK